MWARRGSLAEMLPDCSEWGLALSGQGCGEERKGMLSRGAACRGRPSPVWGLAELAGDRPREAGRNPVQGTTRDMSRGWRPPGRTEGCSEGE